MFKTTANIVAVIAVWAGALLAGPATAQDFRLSEVRVGVLAHDVYSGFLPVYGDRWNPDAQIEDLSVDLLFELPDAQVLRWLGSPRLNLGGSLSLTGKESLAHLGATWTVPVFDTPFFIEGTFGGAIHNAPLSTATASGRNLGCRVNFYEAAGIGANLGDNVTAMLTYEHTSNAGLCGSNHGLSNLGIKVGFKLD